MSFKMKVIPNEQAEIITKAHVAIAVIAAGVDDMKHFIAEG